MRMTRAYWFDAASGRWAFEEIGGGAVAATLVPTPVAGPSDAALLDNAESCPRRVPMPEGRRSGCGCQHLCTAGKGPRWRKGGTTLRDCWDCEDAPRRSWPGGRPPDARR